MDTHALIFPLRNAAVRLFRSEHPFLLQQYLLEQLREAPESMGAEHQIHMTEGFANFFRHVGLLHGAATEADDLVGLTALGVGQGAHVAQHPQLCVLPDGTGVDDDDIRHAGILGEGVAHLPKHPSNLFAVRLVLLAAISVHQRPPALALCCASWRQISI